MYRVTSGLLTSLNLAQVAYNTKHAHYIKFLKIIIRIIRITIITIFIRRTDPITQKNPVQGVQLQTTDKTTMY